jgi:hypothetical protein
MKEIQSIKQRPLMYISQPKFFPVLVNMQQTVVVKKEIASDVEEPVELLLEEKKEDLVDHINNAATKSEEGSKKSHQPIQDTLNNDEKVNEIKAPRRKFNDFSIDEKVDFFVRLPAYIPKSTCLITTDIETFYGKITSMHQNLITVNLVNSPSKLIEIPLKSIKDIQIVSI